MSREAKQGLIALVIFILLTMGFFVAWQVLEVDQYLMQRAICEHPQMSCR